MKIQHKPFQRPVTDNQTGNIDPAYQAEVDRSSAKLQAEYDREQRRLIADQKRAERIASESATGKTKRARVSRDRELRAVWQLIESRRDELDRLARLMQSSPQSSQHRGGGSFRPVPVRHGSNI